MIDGTYSFDVALASIYFVQMLTSAEKNAARKAKKQRVLDHHIDLLLRLYPDYIDTAPTMEDVQQRLAFRFTKRSIAARLLLIDTALADPFAPYDLKFKNRDFDQAYNDLAVIVGLTHEDVEQVKKLFRKAHRAHWNLDWRMLLKLALIGAFYIIQKGGLMLLVRQTFQGATSTIQSLRPEHDLNEFGGRILSIFSPNLAGGMWLISPDETISFGTFGEYRMNWLVQLLGSVGIQQELVKLQVAYTLLLKSEKMTQARTTLTSLKQLLADQQDILTHEQSLNERGSSRVSESKQIIFHLERSIAWIEEHS